MLAFIAITIICLAVYWRTIYYSAVVDDIALLEGRRTSNLRITLKNFIFMVRQRLYGAGTFGLWKDCDMCRGKGEIKIGPDPEHVKIEKCPRCKGVGKYSHVNLKVEHGFTIFLHILICNLIYLSLGHNQVSLIAALLYSVNPTNTQTSIWMNGRRYAVNIVLMLLIVLIGPRGLGLYPMTTLFQINAIFTPVLLGSWWWLVIPAEVALNRKRFVSFYNHRMSTIVNDDMRKWHFPGRVIVVIRTAGFYISQMVWPRRNMMIYKFLHDWGMTAKGNSAAYALDRYFWIGTAAIVGSIAASFLFKGQDLYFLAFLVLSLGQWCNVLTATQTAADRYVSLANVFMMYFLAKLITLTPYTLPIAALFFGYYLSQILSHIIMYKDIQTFYDYHNFYEPSNVTARKFEINWKLKARDPLAAWDLIRTGLVYNPEDFTLLYQAAVCMQALGDYKSSEQYFERAEKNHYINQEPVWRENINKLRNSNRMNLNDNIFSLQTGSWLM